MAEVDEIDAITATFKKRAWSANLDVYLLREVAAHETHIKGYGQARDTYNDFA